jgi:peptidoglycan/LPS O-acetylase OafA/YrhL
MRKIETSKRIQSIDGLRAFAVIAVVLYHLKATGFSNGYLGVDAFFTISGFVITSLLVHEFDNENKINYPKFFRRRFLRLAPSLMLTTIIFLPVCFLWLSPTDYQNFLKSLPPVAFFSGNIYFRK